MEVTFSVTLSLGRAQQNSHIIGKPSTKHLHQANYQKVM